MSIESLPDSDQWAKEECACGCRRHWHANGSGPCRNTVTLPNLVALPPAQDGTNGDPQMWPPNWPLIADLPEITEPCGCAGFNDLDLMDIDPQLWEAIP